MKVILMRKLADRMDGVDVTDCQVGDVLDLGPDDARILIAERWAIQDRREHVGPGSMERRRAADVRVDTRLTRVSCTDSARLTEMRRVVRRPRSTG
jgi:hypothetical protein